MARARTHTLNPKHLAVLQWFDRHSVVPGRPEGWTSETRLQHQIRINGQRIAIGEELHDLTVQLNEKDDPFIIVHPSKKHYRISDVGRALARKCKTVKRTVEGQEVEVVIEAATGRPPIIRSYDQMPQVQPDDDEMLDDYTEPPADAPQEAEEPDLEAADTPPTPEPELQPLDAADAGLQPAGYDEINDAPARREPPPKRNPLKAPPAKMAMPAIGKPARPAKRPAHSKATAPGLGD